MNKFLLWGGVGLAALAGGFVVFRAATPKDTGSASSDLSYYPATVYGSGLTSSSSGVSDGSSGTDGTIAAMIANTLATAQLQSNTTLQQSADNKAIALAGYAKDQAIAANDNETKLQLATLNNRADVQKTLAGQLSSLAASLTKAGSTSLIGGVDFTGDKVNINLKKA